VIDRDILRVADKHGEISDICKVDMLQRDPVAVFDQNAVVGEHARKALIRRRHRHRPFQRRAIAIHDEVTKSDPAAIVAAQDRTAMKACGSVERTLIASNDNIVRSVRQLHFNGDFGHTPRQADRTSGGKRQRDK